MSSTASSTGTTTAPATSPTSSNEKSNPVPDSSSSGSWSQKAQDCWKSFVAWREDIGDDQLACTCRIPDQCHCEVTKVNVAGPL